MSFVKAATVGEVAADAGKTVQAGAKRLALFLVNGNYFALDAECTHMGAPLAEGFCEGGELICPWHDARFDLATGAVRCPPATKGVRAYPVRVVGNEIQID